MVVKVNIAEIQNVEMYVNRKLAKEVSFRYYALSKTETTPDSNEIRFYFKPIHYPDEGSKVLVKQFSKKKYASCDEGIKKFAENGKKKGYSRTLRDFQWKKLLVIEQENYWLVIFEED